MQLQASYATMSDVPTGFEGAYAEQDGKAIFTGGAFEFRTEAEFDELRAAKKSAFDEMHEFKNKLKDLDGIDPKGFKEMQDELDVLRAKVKDGGSDEETINSIVQPRVARLTEELTKENGELKSKLEEANGFKLKTEKQTVLNEMLSKSVSESVIGDAKLIIGSALEKQADGTWTSNGKNGFDPGLDPDQLLKVAMESRPHWQKQSTPGHGAGGSSGAGGVKDTPQTFLEIVNEAHNQQ